MDEDLTLSSGACLRIMKAPIDDSSTWKLQPNVQFLSIKQVTNPAGQGGPDRYRLIISDGTHFIQAMLATQLNHLVENGTIKKLCVAVLEKYTANIVQNKRLIIVMNVRVLGVTAEKLGNPQSLDNTLPAATTNNNPSGTSTTPAQQQFNATTSSSVSGGQSSVPQQPQRAGDRGAIFPLEGLSPFQNKWTIKVRVTQKSEIKQWANAKGDGKLFSCTLMDETGEIKATAFNQAVDDLYDRLEEGKVYYISRARVNLAKKKFSHLSNEYELGLERNTEIEECRDQVNVPTVKYTFVPLKDLENVPKDTTCDVIAIAKETHDLSEITSKSTGKTIPKRELTLVDRSGFSVRLTLWGEQAKKYSTTGQPVVAIKGVKVGDFGGRSLSMYSSSTMAINPDITEAHALRGWFDSAGSEANFQSHSNAMGSSSGSGGGINRSEMKTLQQVKDLNLGGSDKPDYFSSRIIVTHMRNENLSYPACPVEGCNRKVTESSEGWRCERCDRTHDKPEYRYILTLSGADYTGQLWLQGFNDVGMVLFGMPANELKALEDRDKDAYDSTLKKVLSQIVNVNCRAKQETFNDTTRIRYGINRIQPLDFTVDTELVLDQLAAFVQN
ncbi:hypothetical protein Clacol_006591 [Clathrus columnatus]|uniref:Replication protein A subunit n=1 Tax=Clathrus columnatus TaxID=1419009 RepID=A0AAV5AHJ1_9AGAM|nr:hypothetical protein Clacol_006591 [Clathrus columnatus]